MWDRVNEAKMKILGIEVSVIGISQQALDKFLTRMVERINARFADGLFLRMEWSGSGKQCIVSTAFR